MWSFLLFLAIVGTAFYIGKRMGNRNIARDRISGLLMHIESNTNSDLNYDVVAVGLREDEYVLRYESEMVGKDYINDRLWLGCLRIMVYDYAPIGRIPVGDISVEQIIWKDLTRNDLYFSYKVVIPGDNYLIINFNK